jgi:hypothetical protein
VFHFYPQIPFYPTFRQTKKALISQGLSIEFILNEINGWCLGRLTNTHCNLLKQKHLQTKQNEADRFLTVWISKPE